MNHSRRKVLAIGSGMVALTSLAGLPVFASAADDAIAALTGGAAISEGGIDLIAPEIAENGNGVPVSVSAPGAVSISIFAQGNPVPKVVTMKFGPLSGSSSGSTRIRLAKTQNVIAIAQMQDGSFRRASAAVKVTISGCGG